MHLVDWMILGGYLVAMIAMGWHIARRHAASDAHDFFLARRSMPAWAVTMSAIATTYSAGTFIGVPEISYKGNLTFMTLKLGEIVAILLVAFVILPPLYRAGTMTIYGYLGKRFGEGASRAASVVFLGGAFLAMSARVFITSIPVSLAMYGDIALRHLIVTILLIGAVGTIYTAAGGIRAVIWTDVFQTIIMLGAAFMCLWLLFDMIPLSCREMVAALRDADGGNKLKAIDTTFDLSSPYTIWGAVLAFAFSKMAGKGVDHDHVQRLLTCGSVRKAGGSAIASVLISIPIILLFLVIGLLLSIFYRRPDLMGAAAPVDVVDDSRQVFAQFLITHLPTGFRGLTIAGVFAATMSSFDSIVNATASSVVGDLYGPWKARRSGRDVSEIEGNASRLTTMVMGVVFTAGAVLAAVMQSRGGQTLISFAMGILAYGHAGLLGVFLTGILTRRGNVRTVVAALIVGALSVLAMQPFVMPHWSGWIFGTKLTLAWTWWTVIGGTLSFLVCVSGRRNGKIGSESQ